MTKRCLDEGLLQAYIDGELSNESAAEAASHIASCDACATALAGFENDSAFFAAAFAPEESINVPSEVLRSRINAAVAQLEDAHGFNRYALERPELQRLSSFALRPLQLHAAARRRLRQRARRSRRRNHLLLIHKEAAHDRHAASPARNREQRSAEGYADVTHRPM